MAAKSTFVLGAGFSYPTGMPLAPDLVDLLNPRFEWKELTGWLADIRSVAAWMEGTRDETGYRINVEQLFHLGQHEIEMWRARQHIARVGRHHGCTPWDSAEERQNYLHVLEENLVGVIIQKDCQAKLDSIVAWTKALGLHDSVISFNYDTLAERACAEVGRAWDHGFDPRPAESIPLYKMHGSMDWVVADRRSSFRPDRWLPLFEKRNDNRRDDLVTGDVEDDCCLWRCTSRAVLDKWAKPTTRGLQKIPEGGYVTTPGLAGLGAYKPLHRVPGLGVIWERAMHAVHECDRLIVIGFSLSDFDTMAQLRFARIAMIRENEGRPLSVIVIDPNASDTAFQRRFERVFRRVQFVPKSHVQVNWATL